MSEEIRFEGLGIAPGVLDTIVTVATQSVSGVTAVGAPGFAGLVQRGRKGTARAVDVCPADEENQTLQVSIHLQAEYGRNLRDLGKAVQVAVADAIQSQVGVDVCSVDVFIDAVTFPEA